VRHILSSINWKSAFGEVTLIVIAVLIALQASEWQNARSERETEEAFLYEIEFALATDLDLLAKGLERYVHIEAATARLVDAMQTEQQYTETMDADFGAFYSLRYIALNKGAYESLKSHGLTLIQDDSLRASIARVFEQTYAEVARSVDGERSAIREVLRPFVLKHFRDLEFGKNATPIDYDSLLQNTEFHNILGYRHAQIERNQVAIFSAAIAEIGELLTMVRQELANR
jgi:hypothetical protein